MTKSLRALAFTCGSMVVGGLGVASPGVPCELPPPPESAHARVVYRLEEGTGWVRFDAKAFMHEFAGKTSKVRGMIRLADPERLLDAEACIRIDADSLETGIDTRDGIMRRDHLETARFPTIDFLLARVEAVIRQADGWDLETGGSLSLHGVTREIHLPVRARRGGDLVRLLGDIRLRMTDYGIRIPTFLFFTVEDEVVVSFDVTARRTQ